MSPLRQAVGIDLTVARNKDYPIWVERVRKATYLSWYLLLFGYSIYFFEVKQVRVISPGW
jgi:hypothetical protein